MTENSSLLIYGANNPILINDPHGLDTLIKTDDQGNTIYEGENETLDVVVKSSYRNSSYAFSPAIPIAPPRSFTRIARMPAPNTIIPFLFFLLLPSNWNSHQSSCELCDIRRLNAEVQKEEDEIWKELINDSKPGRGTKGIQYSMTKKVVMKPQKKILINCIQLTYNPWEIQNLEGNGGICMMVQKLL